MKFQLRDCPPCPPKKVRFEPGSDRFSPTSHSLNLDPDLGFGSTISLNSDPNLGPVLVGSGSNRGSEPNIGITSYHRYFRACQPVVRCYDVITRSTRKLKSCCLLPSSRWLKIAKDCQRIQGICNRLQQALRLGSWSTPQSSNSLQPLLLRQPLVPTQTFSSHCRL
jgi:hypothetical protein